MWTRCGFVADCLEPIKGFFHFLQHGEYFVLLDAAAANISFCCASVELHATAID